MTARITTMDSLRALSAAAVVISHTVPQDLAIGAFDIKNIGDLGVILFFVLSAYLITGQLLTRSTRLATDAGLGVALALFYRNRALRLLPAFFATLLLAAAVDATDIRAGFPWYAGMLANVYFALYPDAEDISAATHFWTIALEWQFYLLWPLVVLATPRRALGLVFAAAFAAGLYANLPVSGLSETLTETGIFTYLDCLATGALLALAQNRGRPLAFLPGLVWPGLALLAGGIALTAWGPEDYEDLYDPLVHLAMSLFSAALIFTSATDRFSGPVRRLLSVGALRCVGLISYSVYLHHYFFIDLYPRGVALGLLPDLGEGIGFAAMIMALSILSASLSWFVLERPALGLRRLSLRTKAEAETAAA